MSGSIVLRLTWDIQSECAFRAKCDPPDHEKYNRLMRKLEAQRLNIPRQDALKLEELIERLTGVTRGMMNGSRQ